MKALNVSEMYGLQTTSCTLACPLGISPQGYIQLIKAGKIREAFDLIYEKNPLPSVCGYICHHPCEQVCKRGTLVDLPMNIRGLKRYLGEEFLCDTPAPYPLMHDKPIAVIGAGPAGLTAAHWLARRGYPVTVFEQSGEAGGMLLRGIPSFRLDKQVVRKEIARLQQAGIKFVFNTKIDYPASIDALKNEYERVIVATGTQVSKGLPIEGNRIENVLLAINLMDKVNSGKEIRLYGNVVVIGGGSVAMDVARTALRIGADHVAVICLECGEDIPAHPWEMQEAVEEGIEIISGVSPTRYVGFTHKLEGVEYCKIKELDLKTFSCEHIPGTEQTLPADFAIVATGQRTDHVIQDESVVFAGDIAGGKCSVIDAMASGRAAALKIDEELSQRPYTEYDSTREVAAGERKYKIYPAVRTKKSFPGMEVLSPEERAKSFALVEKGFDTDGAALEVQRCLSCGYRFVDIEKCIGCGVCSKVCPKGDVIQMIAVPDSAKEEN
jgi:NADPH-dependent glutamate synthase beta subunit-like oxidoreductase